MEKKKTHTFYLGLLFLDQHIHFWEPGGRSKRLKKFYRPRVILDPLDPTLPKSDFFLPASVDKWSPPV